MKDDPDFNIHFVSVIEKNPCIYDYNTKEYSCRITQEKAWENIGKEVKATGIIFIIIKYSYKLTKCLNFFEQYNYCK